MLRYPATIGVIPRHVSLAPFRVWSALGFGLQEMDLSALGFRRAEVPCVPTPELEFIADPKTLD